MFNLTGWVGILSFISFWWFLSIPIFKQIRKRGYVHCGKSEDYTRNMTEDIMYVQKQCPLCREYPLLYSDSRNSIEKLLRRITPFDIFQCDTCKWRGWLMKQNMRMNQDFVRHVFIYGIPIMIVLIVLSVLMLWGNACAVTSTINLLYSW